MKHLLKTFALVLLISSLSTAQTYLDFPIGTAWRFTDARTLGLGGAGVASLTGSASLLLNPATLSLQQSGLLIQVHPALRKLQETRAYPLYNRIDDIIYKSIYAANNHYFNTWQGGISWKPRQAVFRWVSAISAGVFTERDLNYRYVEEVRENVFGDTLLARNQLTHTGTITRYTAGLALRPVKWVTLGLQLGFLRGNLSHDSTISFYKRGYTDVHQRQDWNLQNVPVVFSLGTLIRVNPHFVAGAVVQFPYTMQYQLYPANEPLHLDFPAEITVGFEYRARQELQTRLNIDFNYAFWSATTSTRNGQPYLPLLQDSWAVKAGLEHIFFNKVPFRTGIQYRTSPWNRRTVRTAITAGTGFMGNGWQVDVAGGFSSLKYTYPDLFDDTLYGGNRVASTLDDVEEVQFFGVVTVTINVNTFLRK